MPSDSSQYLEKMASAFTEDADAASRKLALQIDKVRTDKARVFLCGNGGSAANANHWANDLIYGAAKGGRGGVRAHSLSANTSVLMCLANDTGYENIFSGQIEVLASPGDILVALSGSGNSPNILRALEAGNHLGMETWRSWASMAERLLKWLAMRFIFRFTTCKWRRIFKWSFAIF
jgi:D-sedoheptulose 7-phosphate isomerase